MAPTFAPSKDPFHEDAIYDQPFVLDQLSEEAAISFGIIIIIGVCYLLIIFGMLRVGIVASTSVKELEARKRTRKQTNYEFIMASLLPKERGLSDASDEGPPALTPGASYSSSSSLSSSSHPASTSELKAQRKKKVARLRAMSVIDEMSALVSVSDTATERENDRGEMHVIREMEENEKSTIGDFLMLGPPDVAANDLSLGVAGGAGRPRRNSVERSTEDYEAEVTQPSRRKTISSSPEAAAAAAATASSSVDLIVDDDAAFADQIERMRQMSISSFDDNAHRDMDMDMDSHKIDVSMQLESPTADSGATDAVVNPLHSTPPSAAAVMTSSTLDERDLLLEEEELNKQITLRRIDSGLSIEDDSGSSKIEASTQHQDGLDQEFLLALKRVASNTSIETESDGKTVCITPSLSQSSSTNSLTLQLPSVNQESVALIDYDPLAPEVVVPTNEPSATASNLAQPSPSKKKKKVVKKSTHLQPSNDDKPGVEQPRKLDSVGVVSSASQLGSRRETREQSIMTGLKTLKGNNASLSTLSLTSLNITDAITKLIAAALRRNNTVTSLDLSYNLITFTGCAELASALGKLSESTLVSAGISISPATPSRISSRTNLLAASPRGSFGSGSGKEHTPPNGGRIPSSSSTPTTSSRSPRSAPATPVPYNRTLLALDLKGNAIGSKGASALAEALRFNTTLTYLDVSFQTKGKKIGPDGATAFATLLHLKKRDSTDASGLKTLRMARSNICFEGARHLASAIVSNTTLTELDIGHINYIGNSGAMQLGQAIVSSGSRLAWLCVGSHRLPLAPLVGDKRVFSKLENYISLKKRLVDITSPEAKKRLTAEKQERVQTSLEKSLHSAERDLISCRAAMKSQHPRHLTLEPMENEQYLNKSERSRNFMEHSSHGMDDELGVVIATLLKRNATLETLALGHCILPIQRLQGYSSDTRAMLDLSNHTITNVEAIIIGSLVADNKILHCLNLRGNSFAGTEGENFIAYALEKNPQLKLDLARWPPERMHYDGYLALASIVGMSASGAKIEPQRLEGLFYRSVTAIAGLNYYGTLLFDGLTIYIFATDPATYRPPYVVIASVLVCLPTTIYSFNAIRNAVVSDYTHTLYEVLLTVLQITPGRQAWECVLYACETTAYLDYKYVQAFAKQMPWICLKAFIMLQVAVDKGVWDPWVLTSILMSLVSITMVFIMIYDRKMARRLSNEPLSSQPQLARMVADLLTFIGMGKDTEKVAHLINYDSTYTAHYCISYVYQIAGLGARALSIAWICATADVAYAPMLLFTLFMVRVIVLLLHDSNVFKRTLYNNFVHVFSLCVTDSAWSRDLDDRDPVTIRACYIGLAILSTLENVAGVLYSAFLHPRGTMISHGTNLGLFFLCLIFTGVRWFLLLHWALIVQFPELIRKPEAQKKKGAAAANKGVPSSSTFSPLHTLKRSPPQKKGKGGRSAVKQEEEDDEGFGPPSVRVPLFKINWTKSEDV